MIPTASTADKVRTDMRRAPGLAGRLRLDGFPRFGFVMFPLQHRRQDTDWEGMGCAPFPTSSPHTNLPPLGEKEDKPSCVLLQAVIMSMPSLGTITPGGQPFRTARRGGHPFTGPYGS